MIIEKDKSISLVNLLSLRKKMIQEDVNIELDKIKKFFDDNGIKKQGSLVTATFSIELVNGQPLLDMEFLVPMDKKVNLPNEYKLKERFYLVNAIYTRHTGHPNLLKDTYNGLMDYIQKNNLQQITPAYNVQVNELSNGQGIEQLIIDIYIGINPNIL
jgi:effector-binding domain-containing protein